MCSLGGCFAFLLGLTELVFFFSGADAVSSLHHTGASCGMACRARIRVLAKDAAKAKTEFGPYVTPIQGSVNSGDDLKKAMRGTRALVITGAVGQSVRAAAALGVEHIVLASSAGVSLPGPIGHDHKTPIRASFDQGFNRDSQLCPSLPVRRCPVHCVLRRRHNRLAPCGAMMKAPHTCHSTTVGGKLLLNSG